MNPNPGWCACDTPDGRFRHLFTDVGRSQKVLWPLTMTKSDDDEL
jgi:hypothetical protein